ncbi:Membrane protein related to metalloendopeptidase [Minicystis rosea]|nr:Membrane protein related to metalloendopeptidase [Minicystis rosea]
MAIAWAAVGFGLVASLSFLAWAVSVERDERRTTADAQASAEPSASARIKQDDREVTGAFIVAADGASQSGWPADDGILDMLDDTAGDCIPADAPRSGAVVRLIARTDARAEHGTRIVAFEYQASGAAPLRFYGFTGHDGHRLFDEAGARSCGVGWQRPLSEMRRTSRFNPKRMHPILHRLMPHQGTDFGAAKGTPVYASYRGVVDWVGPHGAHGNWVSIIHPDGIETGYAHLSRFASGIKRGDHVHAHQIIGYVGSTGRSTGPHLHWSARRNGEWFDAESLLAHGGRGLEGGDRAAFLAVKANLDRRLDAIALPARVPAANGPGGSAPLVPTAPLAAPRVGLEPAQ